MKLEEMKKRYEAISGKKFPKERKLTVRLYDGFDNLWIDIVKDVPPTEALKCWLKNTKDGKEKTKYGDIDYYSIFPSNTRMHYS